MAPSSRLAGGREVIMAIHNMLTRINGLQSIVVGAQIAQLFQIGEACGECSQSIVRHVQVLQIVQIAQSVGQFLQYVAAQLNESQVGQLRQPGGQLRYEVLLQINLFEGEAILEQRLWNLVELAIAPMQYFVHFCSLAHGWDVDCGCCKQQQQHS